MKEVDLRIMRCLSSVSGAISARYNGLFDDAEIENIVKDCLSNLDACKIDMELWLLEESDENIMKLKETDTVAHFIRASSYFLKEYNHSYTGMDDEHYNYWDSLYESVEVWHVAWLKRIAQALENKNESLESEIVLLEEAKTELKEEAKTELKEEAKTELNRDLEKPITIPNYLYLLFKDEKSCEEFYAWKRYTTDPKDWGKRYNKYGLQSAKLVRKEKKKLYDFLMKLHGEIAFSHTGNKKKDYDMDLDRFRRAIR